MWKHSNTPGVAVGMSLKVVPKVPWIGIVRGGATAAVAKTRAAQPSARLRLSNRVNFVILFFLYLEDRHPKLLFALAALSWPSLLTTGKLEEPYGEDDRAFNPHFSRRSVRRQANKPKAPIIIPEAPTPL